MTITREILVYSCMPFRKYRWISYVTIGQVSFMVVNLFVIPTPELMAKREAMTKETKTENAGSPSSTLGQRLTKLNYKDIFTLDNIVGNLTGRPFFSGGLVLASVLISLGLVYRARRAIHTITLLPNDKVRISTFSPIALGKPPTYEIPLSHVSCQSSREAGNNYTMLKIKGRMGVHLLDKAEGKFHEPKLFDQYLGYARSWAR